MFSKLPPILRLSLCLLLSTGVHGGLSFYDWMTVPAGTYLAQTPVLVTLLPATEVVSSVATEELQPVPEPALSRAEAETTPRPVKKSVRTSAKTVPPAVPTVASHARPLPPEEACQTSAAVPPECSADALAASPVPTVSGDAVPTPAIVPVRSQQGARQNVAKAATAGLMVPAPHSLTEAAPDYRSNPLPEYPLLARQKHWQGVVWLLVDVSAEGLVDDLRVEESCGHRLLDRAASRTVRRWQFTPAKRAGVPVASQVRIPVRFHLEGG